MLWPVDEPWPRCCDADPYDHDYVSPAEPEPPLVPILQLFAEDVPEIPFPDGTDVLQVLWCPFDHDSFPRPELRWRRRADVGARRPAMPEPDPESDPERVPRRCLLDPERVTEYPSWDLPKDVRQLLEDRFSQLKSATGWDYEADLSVAPGTKIGGYPGWVQLPDWPVCDCGKVMNHLLTVASLDFDDANGKRWVPLEDRPVPPVPSGAAWYSATEQNPTGLMIGDVGGMYLFVCTSCTDRPFAYRFDNS
ncbi:hypothetical protein [Actinoplanes sichuanensis]|uniref:hypothetical protein n=1 Tax=Actinoplanes sichuanensis TaxID=512349 RepID=UPI0029541CA4|nr:hypothetical protein [Actinoplanes sichuanensis]